MVASSSSMPRCQPKPACRSRKRAVTVASGPTASLCSVTRDRHGQIGRAEADPHDIEFRFRHVRPLNVGAALTPDFG